MLQNLIPSFPRTAPYWRIKFCLVLTSGHPASLKDERRAASKILKGPASSKYSGDKMQFLECIRKALYASKIISYTQGFMLLREASKLFEWDLNYGAIALMWRGGCIIRSVFLGNIKQAYDKNLEPTEPPVCS